MVEIKASSSGWFILLKRKNLDHHACSCWTLAGPDTNGQRRVLDLYVHVGGFVQGNYTALV
jgi:hypothetical protein